MINNRKGVELKIVEERIRNAVCKRLGVAKVSQKLWNMGVSMALKDVYIHYICFEKDVPYEYL